MAIRLSTANRAYAFLVLAAFFWAGNSVAGKLAVGHISPFLLTLIRWMLALAAIVAVSVPQLKRDAAIIRSRLVYLLLLGAVGFTAFNAFLYTAVYYTGAINVAIEQAGVPGMIFLGNFLLFGIGVSRAQVAGFLLTLLGVALTASNGALGTLFHLKLNFGDGLMLLAVLVYALYTLGLRYKPVLHWKSLMAVSAAGAMLAALPLAAWEWYAGTIRAPDAQGWLAVLYTAIFPSLGSQTFFVLGVEAIGSNRAGLFVNMIPVFGIFLAVTIAGETPHGYHIAAMALVIAGIALAEYGRKGEAAA